jgi:hypothetical protein
MPYGFVLMHSLVGPTQPKKSQRRPCSLADEPNYVPHLRQISSIRSDFSCYSPSGESIPHGKKNTLSYRMVLRFDRSTTLCYELYYV